MGYTMIDCIPCKTAKFVAHVLQSFFGHVGYPFIFHTDNGKEFTGKNVLAVHIQHAHQGKVNLGK